MTYLRICAALVVTLALATSAVAETVEVAPGVQVTKRTYKTPLNEQPFYGFVPKDAAQREADEKFVSSMVAATGSREKAFDEATTRAWRAVIAGKAARRLNIRLRSLHVARAQVRVPNVLDEPKLRALDERFPDRPADKRQARRLKVT